MTTLLHLKRAARGELAGPCPFGRGGRDRFRVWPATNRCFCRYECAGCPLPQMASGGGRWAWLDQIDVAVPGGALAKLKSNKFKEYATSAELLEKVAEYEQQIEMDGYEYLVSRGIGKAAIKHFRIGQYAGKVMIPNIFRKRGGLQICSGVKGRVIQPQKGQRKYWAVPGTNGMRLFNLNSIFGGGVHHFLYVESIMEPPMLWELGIPAVAPFGGAGVWGVDWARFFSGKTVFIVMDVDEPDGKGQRPGLIYARKRATQIPGSVIVLPPGGLADVGEACQQLGSTAVKDWYTEVIQGGHRWSSG